MTKNPKSMPFWITMHKTEGDEWIYFRKTFTVDVKIAFSEVLFNSYGVCSFSINGNFVECSTARFPGRINRHETTRYLRHGTNIISLKLGSSFFQPHSQNDYDRRGFWFSKVAFQAIIHRAEGVPMVIVTDETWKCSTVEEEGWEVPGFDDRSWSKCEVTSRVGVQEYYMVWEEAALWRDRQLLQDSYHVEEPVSRIACEEYDKNLARTVPEYIEPVTIVSYSPEKDGMLELGDFCDGIPKTAAPTNSQESRTFDPFVIVDFGKVVVGYPIIQLSGARSGIMRCEFDYTESLRDFTPKCEFKEPVKRMAINTPLTQRTARWTGIRRRAFRYLKVSFTDLPGRIRIEKLSLKASYYPVLNVGWFQCSDETLNSIWEVSRYTLHVNMHHEYESCPRVEMLFFTGDGRIDTLVDFYTFGDGQLLRSSLSLRWPEWGLGLNMDNINRERCLVDYLCWRIIAIYDYYMHTGDVDFVQRYYQSAANALEWLISEMGPDNLIFQSPVYPGNDASALEWTCSRVRLGKKASLNSLFYASLLRTAELAGVVGDAGRRNAWTRLAFRVRDAINSLLWSDEHGAYVDAYFDYIPQDGNTLALLFGISDKERAGRTLKTMKDRLWSEYGSAMFDKTLSHTRGGSKTISPLMCLYEAEAHFTHGTDNDALDLIRRCWGTMLRKGAKTFWEFAPNDGSTRWPIPSHAWSSGPAYLLPAYVLGVRPLEPGFEVVLISPKIGDLQWARGVVPTPRGSIAVHLKKQTDSSSKLMTKCTVWIPEGIRETHVVIPAVERLCIDGCSVWENGRTTSEGATVGISIAVHPRDEIYAVLTHPCFHTIEWG